MRSFKNFAIILPQIHKMSNRNYKHNYNTLSAHFGNV